MNENVGREIDYLMLRRNAKSTVFATVQEPWRASAAPKVPDHEATVLHVKLIDGTRRIFFVNYSSGEKTIGKVTTNADVATWEIAQDETIKNAKHSKGALFKMR